MTRMKKSVAIFSAFFPPAFLGGGPIRTLSATVKAAPENFQATVITSDTDLGQSKPLSVQRNQLVLQDGFGVFYVSVKKLKCVLDGLRFVRKIRPEIIYLNSFFDFRFSILPQMLTAIGYFSPKHIGVAPRGEFSSAALQLKGTKKRLYLALYRRSGMMRRVIWHASSDREAADIRRALGQSSRVITRENDSDLPAHSSLAKRTSNESLRTVFVGRIVPIKGLHILLEALKECAAPLTLDVYGPEEDASYSADCKRRAKELPDNVRVNFMGAVPNNEVRAALPQYDLMTFPTLGENFGHVIAEALAVSCPVMCADVTPWTSRLAAGGGVVVEENTVRGWASAISRYAATSHDEQEAARHRAGQCFDKWRHESVDAHVFTMLLQM